MSVVSNPPQTLFAPADRLTPEALPLQVAEMENLGALVPVFDSMPDVVMILNKQRQIIFGNKILRDLAAARQCSCYEGLRPGELLDCRQADSAPNGCGTGESCR